VLGAVAGCTKPTSLDVGAARKEIRSTLRTAFGVPVSAPTCPAKIRARTGGEFTCTVVVAGHRTKVHVKQRDDHGTLLVVPTEAVVETDRVGTELVKTLRNRLAGRTAKVTCPGPAIRVVPPGTTFTCTAKDGRTTHDVTVRVRDVGGSLTFTIKD
jgi:hypothetical protein